MKSLAVALALLTGCNWAVKHPAGTGGIVAGSLALGTCELAAPDARTNGVPSCLLVGGSAGLGIFLITAAALWLGSEDETTPAKPGEAGTLDDPSNLDEAPVFVPRKKQPEPKPEPPKPPDPTPPPTPDPTPAPTPDPTPPPSW